MHVGLSCTRAPNPTSTLHRHNLSDTEEMLVLVFFFIMLVLKIGKLYSKLVGCTVLK